VRNVKKSTIRKVSIYDPKRLESTIRNVSKKNRIRTFSNVPVLQYAEGPAGPGSYAMLGMRVVAQAGVRMAGIRPGPSSRGRRDPPFSERIRRLRTCGPT